MNTTQTELLKRLLATFQEEAKEHLRLMSAALIDLEHTTDNDAGTSLLDSLFREAHSLKGAARAVNLTNIEAVCQSLETVLSSLKRGGIQRSGTFFDTAHRALDAMGGIVAAAADGGEAANVIHVVTLTRQLSALANGTVITAADTDAGSSPTVDSSSTSALYGERSRTIEAENGRATFDDGAVAVPPNIVDRQSSALSSTVRISTARLDALMLQAEELLSAKLTAAQRSADLRNVLGSLQQWKKEWTRVSAEVRSLRQLAERQSQRNGSAQVHRHLAKLLEFVDWNQQRVGEVETELTAITRSAEQEGRALANMVDNLLEDAKEVLLLPFSSLLELFPKMVRDLSHDSGKEVEFVVHGDEIEIDKRILEEMKDPLIHIMRNCIDHGIEKPAERARRGKPPRGTITVATSQLDSSRIEIRVTDDGAGIDAARVKEAAMRRGLISAEQAQQLGGHEARALIFQSELSTSSLITDLSGRGLGLAIVREKVERLGGYVSVETVVGISTAFRIVLPVTLATFRGILVRVGDQLFVVPTAHVERVTRVKPEDIQTVENKETVILDRRAVSLVWLGEVLGTYGSVGLPRKERNGDAPTFHQDAARVPVMVLGAADHRIAFVVDQVLSEQEVLVKRLMKPLSRVRNIAGATVLGTGKAVPILNVADLLKSAVRASAAPVRAVEDAEGEDSGKRAVLVAEDSITSRVLLQNILESAGYEVQTAVDGVEAFTALRTRPFDLLVSDVQMPRMDGFALTAKIRADKSLVSLPVVLVTALEAREDRERGIDVGANAYLVKSSFDQSNLLEVIGRLI